MRRLRSIQTQSGFSLLELMLALMLGVIVTAGIVQLFVGNNQTTAVLNGQSRLQESARYAMDFISRSARTAGYVGCDPGDNLQSGLNGVNLGEPGFPYFELDIANPIEVFNYSGGGSPGDVDPSDWTGRNLAGADALEDTFIAGNQPSFTIDAADPDPGDMVAGADILVLRRLDAPGVPTSAIVQPNDPIVVEDGSQFAANDFVVIANCNQATLVRVTGVAGNTLAWADGPGLWQNYGLAGASPRSSLSAVGQPYGSATSGEGSAVYPVVTDVYYIAYGAGTNNRGDRVMSLWRKSGTAAPVELVEGVTDLQVWAGVDRDATDNVDAPEQYVSFNAVAPGELVRALRIQITSTSGDVVDFEAEEELERTFTQTIMLRNERPVS